MNAEPYKIKMVEAIRKISRTEREQKIREAGYNLFALKAEDVYIDLLTDSGTGAMSDRQWAGMMLGDESYAGSRSFYHLEQTVQELTGHQFVIPVHQGRGAEQVLFPVLIGKTGNFVAGNIHFDTTKAHIELAGGKAVNFVIAEAFDTDGDHPFKGNVDLGKLRHFIEEKGAENVSFIVVTITCNSAGGQPVSMQNLAEVSRLGREYGIPVIIDAARFAENAYFIKMREPGFREKSLAGIVREMFSHADGFTMSAKKDGLVNIGGLIGIKDNRRLYDKCRSLAVALEGFPTYGGLAGRDMEALAVGLREAIDEDYLHHRIGQVSYLGQRLMTAGIPVQKPIGGHAVFVDAAKFLPHIPSGQFPGQALAVALYIEAGVRGVEIGSFLLGRDPDTHEELRSPVEFLRLTIPRRTYTDRHMDVVADALSRLYEKRELIRGLRIVEEPEILRHFTARLEPV